MATHSESLILRFAAEILSRTINPRVPHHLRTFRCYFGVSPFIAGCILDRLNDQHLCTLSAADIRHLLWALLFLKVYSFEEVMARLVGYTPKTYRQHVWSMLDKLAALSIVSTERVSAHGVSDHPLCYSFALALTFLFLLYLQIRWENRYLNYNGSRCLITIDGTDFMINEPFPFEPGYYSHKFHRAGLRYELGVSIQSGDIVWLNGPFPCGRFADQKIAKDEGLEDAMDAGERYLCDGV